MLISEFFFFAIKFSLLPNFIPHLQETVKLYFSLEKVGIGLHPFPILFICVSKTDGVPCRNFSFINILLPLTLVMELKFISEKVIQLSWRIAPCDDSVFSGNIVHIGQHICTS